MTTFLYTRDLSGQANDALQPCANTQSVLLAANVAQAATVPAQYSKWYAEFVYAYNANVFVRLNNAATVPDGTIGVETSQFRPKGWVVENGDTISFITPDASGGYVSVNFFGIE